METPPMPVTWVPQAKPALNSFSAPEPGIGAPLIQEMSILAFVDWKTAVGMSQAVIAVLAMGETSPNTGARKDVPHEPLTERPASSETIQVKASFGLLVPAPKSLYWSCRHDASKSSFLIPGRALASPKTGTFNCVKTAQTDFDSGSDRMGRT